MRVDISQQLLSFGASILLGLTLGLLYDLLRSLRRSDARSISLADGLYCGAAFCAVFYFALSFGDGELRIYMLLGILGGGILFFCLFSQWLRPVWDFWAACVGDGVALVLFPLRFLQKIVGKIRQKTKGFRTSP